MKYFLVVVYVFRAVVAFASASSCESPNVTVAPYTASDAQALTHVPFIADFKLTCKGTSAPGDFPLYAFLDGSLVHVPKNKDGTGFQIAWTTILRQARPGQYSIDLFGEDGYLALKRAMDRGDNAGSVKPLTTITIPYAGSYKGAYVSSELIAATLSILVFYFAYTTKAKLLA